MSRPARAPANCAVCGADLLPSARACPECGADERTGWREPSLYDGLDLPDSAFEDENEAGGRAARNQAREKKARFWWLVAVAMLVVVVVLVVLNRFWVAP